MDRRILEKGNVKLGWHKPNTEGFSLLEAIVAMTITVIVMMAILGMFNQAHRLYARNKRLIVATNLATKKMDYFKTMNFDGTYTGILEEEIEVVDGFPYALEWKVFSGVDVDGDGISDMTDSLVKISLEVKYTYWGQPHKVSMATMTTGKPQ